MLQISIEADDREKYGNVSWPAYVNPALLLMLYYTLACETRYWFMQVNNQDK